jgi:hypothetical protein
VDDNTARRHDLLEGVNLQNDVVLLVCSQDANAEQASAEGHVRGSQGRKSGAPQTSRVSNFETTL